MDIKEKFKRIYEDHPYPVPLSYYGKLMSLAGAVYEIGKDEYMDHELNELSKYVQSLVKLKEFENQLKIIFPPEIDFRHMFDTGIDYRQQNLHQVSINFPEQIIFPDRSYQIPDNLIKGIIDNLKNAETFNFNTCKIIAWIKSKINLEEE